MRHKRRGILMIDAAIGLITLLALTTALAVVLSGHSRVAGSLAATREAIRLAENALADLQSGQEPAPTSRLAIVALPDEPPTPHLRWVRVTAECDGHKASLVGLAPRQPLKAGEAP